MFCNSKVVGSPAVLNKEQQREVPGCSGAKKSTKHDVIHRFHNLSATMDSQQNKPFLMYNVAQLHIHDGTIHYYTKTPIDVLTKSSYKFNNLDISYNSPDTDW